MDTPATGQQPDKDGEFDDWISEEAMILVLDETESRLAANDTITPRQARKLQCYMYTAYAHLMQKEMLKRRKLNARADDQVQYLWLSQNCFQDPSDMSKRKSAAPIRGFAQNFQLRSRS
jgi:hypothetical protein